jgi:FKBP-type peptidyl-prolyl cis-trans isomerase
MKKGLVGLLLISVICFAACHKTVVTPTVYQQFTHDSTAIAKFIADNHINATFHDSIWYVLNKVGTGPLPTRFNCVTIKYTGYEFDALLTTEGTPAPFQTNTDGLKGPLKGLISGMQIALKKFPEGSIGRVFMPSYLGYGSGGQRDANGAWVVHPNEVLVFDIELVQLSDYNVAGNYCYE